MLSLYNRWSNTAASSFHSLCCSWGPKKANIYVSSHVPSLKLQPYKIQTLQPLSAVSIYAQETVPNNMVQRIDDGNIQVGSIWFIWLYLDGFCQ